MHVHFAEISDDAHFFREASRHVDLSNKKNLRSIGLLTAKIQPLIGGDLAILLISKRSLTISLPNPYQFGKEIVRDFFDISKIARSPSIRGCIFAVRSRIDIRFFLFERYNVNYLAKVASLKK